MSRLILFRPICWLETVWNLLRYRTFPGSYIDGHEYILAEPDNDNGLLICARCGHDG